MYSVLDTLNLMLLKATEEERPTVMAVMERAGLMWRCPASDCRAGNPATSSECLCGAQRPADQGWILFLDDIRNPKFVYDETLSLDSECWFTKWTVARSSEEAKRLVLEKGMPTLMSLDHDLGGPDTSIDFLSWLAREYWDGESAVPRFKVHSANPEGSKNIRAFMDSWRKSIETA
jgi:hypothetical protein